MSMGIIHSNQIVGDIDIQYYGIQAITLITESSFSPRMVFRHFDDKTYSYQINPSMLKNKTFKQMGYDLLKEHINKHCIKMIRKNKLMKINQENEN